MTNPGIPEEGTTIRPLRAAISFLVATVLWFLPTGLDPKAHATLCVLVAVAGMWMSEALPLGATALLVPVLGVALGAADAKTAFAGFGDPIVFMFLGTFLLTDAATRHGLDRRLADRVMTSERVRRSPRMLLWAIAFLGLTISAWVNNTATTAMLLPLAMTSERLRSKPFLTSVLLMTAYAPSLGGLATPVGTAPNIIGRDLIAKYTGTQIDFATWTFAFAPLAILATAGSAFWLARRAGKVELKEMPDPTHEIRLRWTLAERTLVPVFLVVILLWITPGILKATPLAGEGWVKGWSDRLPEACVPLVGGLLLFVLPSGAPKGSPLGPTITNASALGRIDWGTILLFGGGISLGGMLQSSGLAKSLGQGLFDVMPIDGAFGITLAATLVAVLVSELTSNTASATLVVPIVIELAKAAGTDPVAPALAATIGCSFGFMLPVSTPPNAIVYGTGKLSIGDMVRAGLALDIAGAILVAVWMTFVW